MRFAVFLFVAFVTSFAAARWTFRASLSTHSAIVALPETPAAARTSNASYPDQAGAAAPPRSVREALAGDDALASAAQVVAWLDTTTAETFRKFAEEPNTFPMPRFSGFHEEFRAAYFEAIAARWLALDPEGALPAMQRVQAELDKGLGNQALLHAASRLRPELVIEQLPLEGKNSALNVTATAVKSLAARDLKAARKVAERWPDPPMRENAARWIAEGVAESVAEKDPVAAVPLGFEIAMAAAERIGPGMVRQVLQAAGGKLGRYTDSADFILRHPDLASEMSDLPAPPNARGISEATLAEADRKTPEERERLLGSYDSLPAAARDGVAAALCSAWARTEPRQAAEWAVAHGRPDDRTSSANEAAQQVFLRWVNNDSDAALAWWRALPSSELRDALGTNASTYLAEDGQLDAALELFRPSAAQKDATQLALHARGVLSSGSSEPLEQQATAHLAQILVERDPGAAGAWYAKLPANGATDRAARPIVTEWYQRDAEAVARWIATLPAGVPRDEAAKVFVEQAAQLSAEGAAEWVETLTDAALRQYAAGLVFREMLQDNPAAARQWIRGLGGVDAEWRDGLLRRGQ